MFKVYTLYAYNQNVIHYSVYRGISVECDVQILHFSLRFQSGGGWIVWLKRQKNNVEMLQNFGIQFYVTPIHFRCFERGQE